MEAMKDKECRQSGEVHLLPRNGSRFRPDSAPNVPSATALMQKCSSDWRPPRWPQLLPPQLRYMTLFRSPNQYECEALSSYIIMA